MEVKTQINFETVKGERKYIFSMPVGGTLGEAYDAAFEVLERLLTMSKEAAEKAKQVDKEKVEEDGKE